MTTTAHGNMLATWGGENEGPLKEALGLLQVQFRAFIDAGCSVLGYLPYPSGEELAQSALKRDWKHMEEACSSKASGAFMQDPGWVGKGRVRTLTFHERIRTLDAEAISEILGAHAKKVSEDERVSIDQSMQRNAVKSRCQSFDV